MVINTVDEKGKNRIILLELNPNKDNIEVVHWHYIGNGGLKRIKKQAEREGEHILVLPSSVEEEAGALPGRPSDLTSEDKDSEKSTRTSTSTSEETSQATEVPKLRPKTALFMRRMSAITSLIQKRNSRIQHFPRMIPVSVKSRFTRSGLEGLFSDLKTKVRVHSGIGKINRMKLIDEYISETTDIPAPSPEYMTSGG